MKKIAVSQRIDFLQKRNEKRDSLDQNYVKLLTYCGFIPFPIPNAIISEPNDKDLSLKEIKSWFQKVLPDGILLTGGNDFGEYIERDTTELISIEYAKENLIPILGICRGMQLIAISEGINLFPINGHIGLKHRITGEVNQEVLCFHKFAIEKTPKNFEVIATSKDGLIEGIRHKVLPIEGWMWHPERMNQFSKNDIKRIKNLFC